uniref:Uncharacterized protein n=1 Tax=Caenorhabditis japonica TaxID=281687 RepID=A0A8R1IEF6_CAEJA
MDAAINQYAMMRGLNPVAFMNYIFKQDSILQRIPEGMQPGDTREFHVLRYLNENTETHQFETLELAEKFIDTRCREFMLLHETSDFKYYVCPHGQKENCVAYAKLFLGLGVNIVRVCFGHYDHDIGHGQPRFTTMQFATLRLFSDFYWKRSLGAEWNVHNIVYCFKHWYPSDNPLHFLSIYDLKAIAREVQRPEALSINLPNGCYHGTKIMTEEDSHSTYLYRNPANHVEACHGEGSAAADQIYSQNGDTTLTSVPLCNEEKEAPSEEPVQPSETSQEWYTQGNNPQYASANWVNIHNFSTELMSFAFQKMLAPQCTEQAFNDASKIFELLTQAVDLARKINVENPYSGDPSLPQHHPIAAAPTYSVYLDENNVQQLYPVGGNLPIVPTEEEPNQGILQDSFNFELSEIRGSNAGSNAVPSGGVISNGNMAYCTPNAGIVIGVPAYGQSPTPISDAIKQYARYTHYAQYAQNSQNGCSNQITFRFEPFEEAGSSRQGTSEELANAIMAESNVLPLIMNMVAEHQDDECKENCNHPITMDPASDELTTLRKFISGQPLQEFSDANIERLNEILFSVLRFQPRAPLDFTKDINPRGIKSMPNFDMLFDDESKDMVNYAITMKTKGNVWTMPVPKNNFIPSRLKWATGISLKTKAREHAERFESQSTTENGSIEGNVDKNTVQVETAPLTKNQKKKNKKKNKKTSDKEKPLSHFDQPC